jgi:hypothetical protein
MNWLLATRAVAHGVVAIMITFAQIDNVLNSLVLFGSLYLAASLGTTFLDRRYKLTSPSVGLPLIAPMVVATLAVAALGFQLDTLLAFRILTALLMGWFVISEIVVANKVGRKTLQGREAVITAVFSAVMLGLAAGANLREQDLVGFFGAYNALLAVHLGIAAATPKK